VESVLIMMMVFYGCKILLKYFHSLAALTEDSEDSRVCLLPIQMKIESALLIGSCIARVVLDVISLLPTIKDFRKYNSPTDCLEDPNNYL